MEMSKIKSLYPLTLAFSLMAALSGCATHQQCGAEGCPGDAKITAAVQAQLAQHTEIGPLVEVQTVNGVVYLNGVVGQGIQRQTAAKVASNTPGVMKVVNNLGISR
jgi:osmotically-inducible protein OsmY